MIKIDKNIEPPRRPYPFAVMVVGDSFFAAGANSRKVCGLARYYFKKGMKFSCRTVTENGVLGVRCWRVA